ncbi:MAG: hypothetical protein MZV49_08470 [Rhodopseudomonas palustris]|nr:hypothetical protein [Rhodopseudomonas palustris]
MARSSPPAPRAKIGGRLRPHAFVCGRRGHARHHLRTDHQAAAAFPETIAAAAVLVRDGGGRLQRGDPGRCRPRSRWRASNYSTPRKVRCCNAYSKLTLPETPLLLLEFHGSAAGSRRAVQEFCGDRQGVRRRRILLDHAPGRPQQAVAGAARCLLVGKRAAPGAGVVATDVCVPISRLADCVVETEGRSATPQSDRRRSSAMSATAISTARSCATSTIPRRWRAASSSSHRLVERAQAMDGTCTGEHGVGQGKQKYMVAELGPEAIEAMRAVKKALDPDNIFNPGKIIPPL